MLGRRNLTQRNLEVVRIVQRVHKISVEGRDVIEDGEALLNASELFTESLLGKLDLPGIEGYREVVRVNWAWA